MARSRKLEPKAREVIIQKMMESGEMTVEEIMDLVRPHYLFDPQAAKEQGIRKLTHQMMASHPNSFQIFEIQINGRKAERDISGAICSNPICPSN